ncbi:MULTISPECIES: HAMP domain-containing sensor histidine kinase [Priestia]|jgi:signal transduction histidine kinase|uniref:Signal transduction histidine-protein kinase ArlS n=10 Tax=Priestia megaterium TaxID=1404 RepID=A0AAE5P3U7_PRIMG|nr:MULTISPECIES: HAMP domain-containing histidine kinase [Priestia]RFB30232.1 sensor histidine kinase [Bacillus sp. ALD]RFB40371.1 sensor histidine kinase [Bacillus sp. RC]MBV6734410.1 HAMP domain-containing histidine kinase [Priestia megaterium]MDD9783714.1 HAMP domain-containing histidine kinase [Priestia megaterium]MDN3229076.1 HAMP domain-containing histidine kinase [Priestia megaterium]
MRKEITYIKDLPIRWKITLWSSMFLFFLFLSYNLFQYIVIDNGILNYEKQNGIHQLKEVLAFIQSDDEPLSLNQIENSEGYLSKINEKNQLIRILDTKGNVITSTSNNVSPNWQQPKTVKHQEYKVIRKNDERLLVLRSPIVTDNFSGTVEIIRNMEMSDAFMDKIFLLMIAAGVGSLIFSILGGTILAKKILSNIQALTLTMKKIKTNGLEERVPVNEKNDEFAQLGSLFNELMDSLEDSFLQQKQFVEDASHELRTPLAIIQGHLMLLNRWGKNDAAILDKSLKSSLKEVERLTNLVQELLELSRAENSLINPVDVEPINVWTTVQHVVRNFEVLYSNYEFKIKHSHENLYVNISSRHLEQILIILLDNAVKYSKKEEKEVVIDCSLINEKVSLKVMDKGIGIPEEDIPYILNRFYRVDKARSRKQGGLGLGLAIAKRWVEQYHGTINIESKEGEGTNVTIVLPLFNNSL